jgi:cobalt-precorrin 5A hydrolase/precorrin-3B C17-methyltransferase
VTDAGGALARRLPFEHRAGPLLQTVRAEWASVDGLVLVAAAGVAVRAVAPLLAGKRRDPAVVCVDDAGRFAIALCGGHVAGANALANEVASLLGATAVVTTASDAPGAAAVALDDLPGFDAGGDLAGVTRAWLDGDPPALDVDAALADWPRPEGLKSLPTRGGHRITLTDGDDEPAPGQVVLRPRSVIVGAGASTGADAAGLWDLIAAALAEGGVHPGAVATIATLDRKTKEPALVAAAGRLGVSLTGFAAAQLAGVEVPNPSAVVAGAVGTPSVAEAAAVLASGPGARLLVTKRVSATGDSTVAVARRTRPGGHLAVVGIGPGAPTLRTAAATAAIRHADTVIGYAPYVDQVADLLRPSQRIVRAPIGAEAERCRQALERAGRGEQVALVCSGDPGVYAMASLVCQLAPATGDPPVTVVPGVTAANSGAAVVGAPLGHDHASISLSDLLTPWAIIAGRVRAAAEGDFVVSFYNPRSARRSGQLAAAVGILSGHRPPTTPAAVITDIGRPEQTVIRTTLSALDPSSVSMRSLVIIGSSATRWIGDRMVTPRGYPPPSP